MALLANVSLQDTFDTWRIRTNQLIAVSEQAYEISLLSANAVGNTINVTMAYSNDTSNSFRTIAYAYSNNMGNTVNSYVTYAIGLIDINMQSSMVYSNAVGNSVNSFTRSSYTTLANGRAAFTTANSKIATVAGNAGRILVTNTTAGANITATVDLASIVTATNYTGGISAINVDAYGRVTGVSGNANYQPNLGFTPVQQGGGTSQSSNKIYIGWSAGSVLRLQVDATDFGASWPINVTGTSSYSTTSGTSALTNQTSWTNLTVTNSLSAPIMYDYNNTSFYVNPNGTSIFSVLSVGRVAAGYDSGVGNSINCNGWFRSGGATGWFNGDYGGGIYMTDTTWVRVYGSKAFWAAGTIQSDTDLRAPLLYDTNDTSYYLNPNSTSRLFTLNTLNQINAQGNQGIGIQNATSGAGGIMVQGSGSAAFMSFHRPGAYASYFGIDTDNQFAVGGWSAGAGLAYFKAAGIGVGTAATGPGNINATGTMTAAALGGAAATGVGASGTWNISSNNGRTLLQDTIIANGAGDVGAPYTFSGNPDYNTFEIELINLLPQLNLNYLYIRFTQDGAYRGESLYSSTIVGPGSTQQYQNSKTVGFLTSYAGGFYSYSPLIYAGWVSNTAALGGVNGTLRMTFPHDGSNYKSMYGFVNYRQADSTTYQLNTSTNISLARLAAVQGFQIFWDHGAFASGRIRVYGYKV
jgi:hypothetical protein